MKLNLVILLMLLCLLSCKQRPEDDADKSKHVTFIINELPTSHNFDKDIYLSGDFEGWSGGRKQFKLQKNQKKYSITIPKYQPTINFKFTTGNWDHVECAVNGNPIDNRTYTFSKVKDTVHIAIKNWNDATQQNKQSTATENVHVFAEDFDIPQLNRKRKISVYLPPNYEASSKRYPVLYIQDGQNVFDVTTSYSGEWKVDETLNELYTENGFGLIVVAIDHGNKKRLNEYSAWDNKKNGKGEGIAYLDFLISTLKPEIDKTYRTKPEATHTAVMGSSLGGFFAHYAAIQRPDVFGKAGIFSPSFWYAEDCYSFTKKRVKNHSAKLYYIMGEKEGGNMVSNMERMITLMLDNGFPEKQLHAKIVPNGTHSETLWRAEFKDAITWLFQ